MFALWMFGRVVEYDLGSQRFLTFYLLSGIGAGILYSCINWVEVSAIRDAALTSYSASEKMFLLVNTPVLGASGAIYGVLLGFGMLHPNSIIMLIFPPIPMKAKYFVLIFMAIELIWGVRGGDGVAHFAHVTGMISAFILLKYWKAKGKIFY
jgi:membrane associated rhomboid family serine protease